MALSKERQAYYKAKIQGLLAKDPSLDYHRTMEAIDFEAWKAMRILHIEFACAVWPFGGNPEKIDRHAKKYASEGLIHAAALGNIKGAAQWLEMGADVNYQDKDGDYPLLESISRKRLGMAEFLLQHGADANCKNKKGWTPVLKSVFKQIPLAFPLLKKYGADLDKPLYTIQWQSSFPFIRWEKHYPLSLACMTVDDKNGRAVVKSMLKSGVNPNITCEGMPLIDWANRQRKIKSRFWLKGALKNAIKERE